jgi:hypothetical protein
VLQLYIDVELTLLEKRTQRRKTECDLCRLDHTLFHGVLHSRLAEMQAALGAGSEELLWGRQPGNDKGKCPCDFRQLHLPRSQEMISGSVLVVSDSCAFCYVSGYLGCVGVSAWDFWDL